MSKVVTDPMKGTQRIQSDSTGPPRSAIAGTATAVDQFFERFTLHGMPLPDEDLATVIKMHLGMPGQAKVAAVDLMRLAVLIEGRQVYAPDGS